MILKRHVVLGCNHFQGRMTNYREVFQKATGQELFPGTLNVRVDRRIPVREDFRVKGVEITEPEQDLILERCRINGIEAFRIRPLHLKTGLGGHGDETLEIAWSQMIPSVEAGTQLEVELLRESVDP